MILRKNWRIKREMVDIDIEIVERFEIEKCGELKRMEDKE